MKEKKERKKNCYYCDKIISIGKEKKIEKSGTIIYHCGCRTVIKKIKLIKRV